MRHLSVAVLPVTALRRRRGAASSSVAAPPPPRERAPRGLVRVPREALAHRVEDLGLHVHGLVEEGAREREGATRCVLGMPYRSSAFKAAALAAPWLMSGRGRSQRGDGGVAPEPRRATLHIPAQAVNLELDGVRRIALGAAAKADEVEELGRGWWRSIRLLQINS